jgi:raffinose/stachyose/melibiose transport system substrate-binding protein
MTSTFTRRGVLGLTAAAVGGAALTACTGAAPAGQSGGGNPAPASNNLRLFTYEDDATIDLLKAQVKKFDAQAGTTTVIDSLPGSGAAIYPDKLRTELLGGNAPDIWRIWGGEIGAPFTRAGQAADLGEYYEEYGWGDMLYEGAVDGMTIDGTPYGVPMALSAMGIWYSKDAFDQAGLEEPTTYEEVEAANEALVEAGITPLGTGGKFGWHIMRLFQYLLEVTAGPELHDQLLTGEASWDDPAVVEAFELFVKWQDEGWMPQGALGLDPVDEEPGFVQGATAYTITGQWAETNFITSAGADPADYGTFVPPTPHEPQRFSGFVEGYMVAEQSENKDAAAQLIDFLIQPEAQLAMGNGQTATIEAAPQPDVKPLSAQWSQFQQEAPYYLVMDQAFPKDVADGYFQVQSDVLQGNVTPAEAAQAMEELVSQWADQQP